MNNEMTKEQADLFDDLTPLQREITLNSLSGMNDIDSYRNSSGKAEGVKSQEATVCEILGNPKVRKFLGSMRAEAVSKAIMSRDEMLERLSGLARTNMNDLIEWGATEPDSDDSTEVEQSSWRIKNSALSDPLKAASISEVTAGAGGLKIKQHSPLAAMKMISDMQGFNAAVKTEQSGMVAQVQLSKEEYAEARDKMLAEDDC